MLDLVTVLIIAVIVEFSVQSIKKLVKLKKGYSLFKLINVKVLLSIAISIVLCVSAQIGILAMLGVGEVIPLVDYILTGLIVSSGANGIRELQKQIQVAKQGEEK